MWVDKDDVFAEDKVREFKASNPDTRTHIRHLQGEEMPHLPLASPSSSTTSYFLPHVLSMPSNINDPFQSTTPPLSSHHDNLPATTPLSEAAAEFPDEHNSDNDIREAIRLLRIRDAPSESTDESRERILSVQVPNRIVGNADGPSLAPQATHTSPTTLGSAQQGEAVTGYDSDNPLYQPDMRPCPWGCGPLEYCHGHSPTASSTPPLPV